MLNQDKPFALVQLPDGIGTTAETFAPEDYSKERDNALLLHDTGLDEYEVELTFSLHAVGEKRYSSPGIYIAPEVQDGVFERGIAVFVANYGVVAWYEYNAEDRSRVCYAHLGQLARYSDPAKPHVLRCRVSTKQQSLAVQLDDSDVMVLRFLGHPKLSFVQHKLNSSVALWGCHGASTFHEMIVRPGGTLLFFVREPPTGGEGE